MLEDIQNKIVPEPLKEALEETPVTSVTLGDTVYPLIQPQSDSDAIEAINILEKAVKAGVFSKPEKDELC